LIFLSYFQSIELENYRNFKNFKIDFSSVCNVLIGKNGSGKTNVLEAISLFERGRGLRKDSIKDLVNYEDNKKHFNVFSVFLNNDEKINLRLSNEINNTNSSKKLFVNDSASRDSIKHFENLFSLIYFLPEMERLFLNSPSIRRNFLDRLIYSTDKTYSSLINSYKKNVLERHKILKNHKFDNDWISILESKIVDLGINIYKKRLEHVFVLNSNLMNLIKHNNNYYKICINIEDEFIKDKKENPVAVKDQYIYTLKKNRKSDAILGGSSIGPHKSDFVGCDFETNFNINQFSTGQQKTVVLLIILAHCVYLINNLKKNPIILFDEVCSHLDLKNRELLLDLIEILNIQTFMTGTEKKFFSFLSTKASYCNIT